MTEITRYPSQIFWDEDDQGYIAIAPDLPGCSAFGLSESKALKELYAAIGLWIEAANSMGRPIPAPSKLPVPSAYSGKVLLRMASSLHERLAKEAEIEGVSLNQWIVTVLASGSRIQDFVVSKNEIIQRRVGTLVETNGRLKPTNIHWALVNLQPQAAIYHQMGSQPGKYIDYSTKQDMEGVRLGNLDVEDWKSLQTVTRLPNVQIN
jgi:predicted RNase H-like HicB family nuclease